MMAMGKSECAHSWRKGERESREGSSWIGTLSKPPEREKANGQSPVTKREGNRCWSWKGVGISNGR